jgi:hypothetical protein
MLVATGAAVIMIDLRVLHHLITNGHHLDVAMNGRILITKIVASHPEMKNLKRSFSVKKTMSILVWTLTNTKASPLVYAATILLVPSTR